MSSRMSISSVLGTPILVGILVGLALTIWPDESELNPVTPAQAQKSAGTSGYVVLGYNDLGMHCMNQNFAELCILPPFNTLHAQVIRRGEEPRIMTSGVTVKYSVPSNTSSATKTNFWQFSEKLFGKKLPLNVGLTGNGLAGVMTPTGANDWAATGIPITPINNAGKLDPYPLAKIEVVSSGKTIASTSAVVPVSWEISCNLCHNTPGITPDTDILRKHDKLHGTKLEASKPVLCANCHADPALGTTGKPGIKNMSAAMHGSHASRMAPVAKLGNTCYACHPGFKTNCQRDVHFAKGIHCVNCHGDMHKMGSTARQPWVSEPTCGSCHQSRKPSFKFEQPGKLFKDSRGHGGVHCAACHGPPHAITPTVTAADNVQAIQHQGFAGTIKKCTVCHTQQPDEPFFHSLDDDDSEGGSKSKSVAKSPTGNYTIAGTEKRTLAGKTTQLNFHGSLNVINPTNVQINKTFANGEKAKTTLVLSGALRPGVAVQQGIGSGKTGSFLTKATLTFTKTATGFSVAGTTTISEGSTKVSNAAFKGAK